jgi:predicted phage terminase large subunit-like protein
MSNLESKAWTEAVKNDYTAYVYETQNHGLDYSKDKLRWTPTPFHKHLTKSVQEFVEEETGHPYDILLISTPPQVGKSVSITETYPSWYLGHNPENKVIEISYNADFAKKFGRRNREKISEFGFLFDIGLSTETKSMELFELSNKRGSMLSAGVTGGVTGNACDLMIIDDPIKNREEADSETVRKKLYDEWINSYKTRLSAGAKVIVIQTRWHEDDLFGKLAKDPYAKVLNYPMEAEEGDILGRKVGEPLVPEIGKDEIWLKGFKEGMEKGEIESEGETGIRAWNALYQGRPTALEGNLLQRDWWQKYELTDDMEFEHLLLSVDAAFKDNDTSDFVVMQVWGKRGPNCYLVDSTKKHLNFQATMDRIMQYKALYPIKEILIEDKANGTAVIQVLRRKIEGIIAIEPRGSKESRVNAISFAIESGNVYVPSNKRFTSDFIEECSQFPNGKHDDQVDAMSQALNRLIWRRTRGSYRKKGKIELFSPKKRYTMTKGDKIHVI